MESFLIVVVAWAIVHATCKFLEYRYSKNQNRKDVLQA